MESKKDRDKEEYEEWIRIRNRSDLKSDEYFRAKDNAEDIRGDTNNHQVANLTNFIKAYKIETDKNIKSNRNLSLVAIGVAILMPLIPMIIDLITKYCL